MRFSAQHFSSSPGKGKGRWLADNSLPLDGGPDPMATLPAPSSPSPAMGLGWDISEASTSGKQPWVLFQRMSGAYTTNSRALVGSQSSQHAGKGSKPQFLPLQNSRNNFHLPPPLLKKDSSLGLGCGSECSWGHHIVHSLTPQDG